MGRGREFWGIWGRLLPLNRDIMAKVRGRSIYLYKMTELSNFRGIWALNRGKLRGRAEKAWVHVHSRHPLVWCPCLQFFFMSIQRKEHPSFLATSNSIWINLWKFEIEQVLFAQEFYYLPPEAGHCFSDNSNIIRVDVNFIPNSLCLLCEIQKFSWDLTFQVWRWTEMLRCNTYYTSWMFSEQ